MTQFRFKDIKTGNTFYVHINNSPVPAFMDDVIKSIEMSINMGSDECFIGEMTFMYGRSCEVTLEKREWAEYLFSSVHALEKMEQYEKCQMLLSLIKRI